MRNREQRAIKLKCNKRNIVSVVRQSKYVATVFPLNTEPVLGKDIGLKKKYNSETTCSDLSRRAREMINWNSFGGKNIPFIMLI